MRVQDAKNLAKSLCELGQYRRELSIAMRETTQGVRTSKRLWHEGNRSKLINIGIAIFMFPEPTPISSIVGVGVIAAGLIQKGIKNQAIYIEDIPKSLKNTIEEISSTKYDLKI